MTNKKHKEKASFGEEFDGTIDLIDKENPIESNKINLREASEDPQTPNYAVNPQSGLVYDANTKGDPLPIVLAETSRFCHDRTNEIPADTLVQSRDSGRTPRFAKTDSTADAKVKA
jgi:hypothetical protein